MDSSYLFLFITKKDVCSYLETRRLCGSTKIKAEISQPRAGNSTVFCCTYRWVQGPQIVGKSWVVKIVAISLYIEIKHMIYYWDFFGFSLCGRALCAGIPSSTVCDWQPRPSSYLRLGFGLWVKDWIMSKCRFSLLAILAAQLLLCSALFVLTARQAAGGWWCQINCQTHSCWCEIESVWPV